MNLTNCVGFCTDLGGLSLAGVVMVTYTMMLGGIYTSVKYATRLIHDFALECAAEQRRQGELFEKFMNPEDADVDE